MTKLKREGYIPRIVDNQVRHALENFGGVEICGTRWAGKSWTAETFANSLTRVDANPEVYGADPSLALVGEHPHVIDEWQDVPSIWNIVRHRIDDESNRPGQFILTGSSSPREQEQRHSGAGRIARVRMSTMALSETGESNAAVSIADLFEHRFTPAACSLGLAEVAHAICRGGWPAVQGGIRNDPALVVREYLDALFEVSMPKAGKSPTLSRRIAQSLARNVATSATLKTIALDASAGEASAPDTDTVASYLGEFTRNYFIRELPGWDAPVRSKSRLRTKPKRYLEDPSLAAGLLDVDESRLISDGQLFGLLFESLCIHDLSVYASALPHAGREPLRYYSDADGLEVDAIIELADGRWAALEIKLGEPKVPEGVKNLRRLRAKVVANPAARNPQPEFAAIILGKCEIARYLHDEDVYIIPLGCLTA